MYEKYLRTLDQNTREWLARQRILKPNNDSSLTADAIIADIHASRESWGYGGFCKPQLAIDLVARRPLASLPYLIMAKDVPNLDEPSEVDIYTLCSRVRETAVLEALLSPEAAIRGKVLRELVECVAKKQIKRHDLGAIFERLLPIQGGYKVFIRYPSGDLLAPKELKALAGNKEFRTLYIKLAVLQEDVEAYKALEAVSADQEDMYAECASACATFLVDLDLFRSVETMGVTDYAKRMAGLLTEGVGYRGIEKWLRQIDDHYNQDLDDQAKYAIFEWLAKFNYRDNLGRGNVDIRSRLPRLLHYVKLSKPKPERLHDLITKMHFGELELLERQGERFSNPELIEMCWLRFSKKTFLETDLFKENAMPLAFIYAFTLDEVAEAPSGDMILQELFKRGGGKECYSRVKDRKLRTKLAAQTLKI